MSLARHPVENAHPHVLFSLHRQTFVFRGGLALDANILVAFQVGRKRVSDNRTFAIINCSRFVFAALLFICSRNKFQTILDRWIFQTWLYRSKLWFQDKFFMLLNKPNSTACCCCRIHWGRLSSGPLFLLQVQTLYSVRGGGRTRIPSVKSISMSSCWDRVDCNTFILSIDPIRVGRLTRWTFKIHFRFAASEDLLSISRTALFEILTFHRTSAHAMWCEGSSQLSRARHCFAVFVTSNEVHWSPLRQCLPCRVLQQSVFLTAFPPVHCWTLLRLIFTAVHSHYLRILTGQTLFCTRPCIASFHRLRWGGGDRFNVYPVGM